MRQFTSFYSAGVDDYLDRVAEIVCNLIEQAVSLDEGPIPYIRKHLAPGLVPVIEELDEFITDQAWDLAMNNPAFVSADDYEILQAECEELEEKLSSCSEIYIGGERFAWVPGREVFVSRLGHVLRPEPVEDSSVSAALATGCA